MGSHLGVVGAIKNLSGVYGALKNFFLGFAVVLNETRDREFYLIYLCAFSAKKFQFGILKLFIALLFGVLGIKLRMNGTASKADFE